MAKAKPPLPSSPSPAFGRLEGLDALRDRLPAGKAPPPAGPASSPSAPDIYARAAKIVLRRERKGHGGKTATRIEGLRGRDADVETAVQEIKRSLGCGAARDGDDIVVQGDHGARLLAFFTARGARKVVVGS